MIKCLIIQITERDSKRKTAVFSHFIHYEWGRLNSWEQGKQDSETVVPQTKAYNFQEYLFVKKNIFLLQVFVGISEAAAVSPSWINARILQLTVYVKRKHERGFRQKYTAQDFYEADKGKMKTEVYLKLGK